MLKKAWYLITHADAFDGVPDAPRLPQTPEITSTLDEVFADGSSIGPAHTACAVEVMLHTAEHLSNAIPHGRHAVTGDQFARLLIGVNLLLGYLAQISGRLAHQVDTGTGADLSALRPSDRALLTMALVTASCRLEVSAGLVKEAHLAVSTSRPGVRR